MKKWLWIVVVIVVIIIIGVAVNKGNDTGTIKIGATLSLSGNLASIGKSELNGLILAAEEINKQGGVNGKKLEIIAEDNQGDPKSAVSGVQKLLNVDKVNLIFSAFTPMTKAVAPVVKEKGVPMLYASTDGSIAASSTIFFRDYFDAEQTATALFKKLQADGIKNIKFLSEQSEAGKVFADAFKEEMQQSDMKIKDEVYFLPTEKDFKTYLAKLNLKKGDVLLVDGPKHANLIIKNISDLGLIEIPTYQFTAPFLAAAKDPAITELFVRNKTISSWYGFADKNNTVKQDEFIKKYNERFKENPMADSAFSYDDTFILATVLKKCFANDKIDNACFKTEMSQINYDGVAGKVSFDPQGRSNRETILIQAVDNQWVTVK